MALSPDFTRVAPLLKSFWMLYGKPTSKFFYFFVQFLWLIVFFVQPKPKDSIQSRADLGGTVG